MFAVRPGQVDDLEQLNDLYNHYIRETPVTFDAGITLPNPASVALHERFGFHEIGRYSEQGRKFGRYWDVVWFEKPLN